MFKPSYLDNPHHLPEPPRRSHKLVFFTLILIVIAGGAVGLYALATSFQAGPAEIAHTDATLTPSQKNGIFGSLRDFFFSSAGPSLQGQAENRINILVLGVGGPGRGPGPCRREERP